MPTYNGEVHIQDQISSILIQLDPADELIIVDDASTDATLDFITDLRDKRIKVIRNYKNVGASYALETALHYARGEFIFLSDQDDVWIDGKVARIKRLMDSLDVDLIVHDAQIMSDQSISDLTLFQRSSSRPGVIKNIIRNTYTGCCMAFRREILTLTMPLPKGINLYHDAWFGILSEALGFRVAFVNAPLIMHRRHRTNASSFQRRSLWIVLLERFVFVLALLTRVFHAKVRKL